MGATTPLDDKIYKIDASHWYQLRPYGFVFEDRFGAQSKMWLPINPSNIQTTTQYATNIVTTLYGVIEEHSEIRYYDIIIQGTTGFAPRYPHPSGALATGDLKTPTAIAAADSFKKWSKPTAYTGRNFFVYNPFSLGGFAQQTVNTLNQTLDNFKDLTGNSSTPNVVGFDVERSGYVAFHNLYRLFHLYKEDTSGKNIGKDSVAVSRKTHPLRFLNYKDNIKYDVVPRSFTLTRSAESPMLYNYSIILRAFNLRGIDDQDDAKDIYGNRLQDLGLTGVNGSAFNKMQNTANKAMAVVGGLASAFGSQGG